MNKILEFETYLSISKTKFGIYLFDTKNKNNLYGKEIIFEKVFNVSDIKSSYFIIKIFLELYVFQEL